MEARTRDRITALAGAATFVAGAVAARSPEVTRAEQRWFRAVNDLPSSAFPAVWGMLQLGSLGGALGTGAAAAALGRPDLGRRLAATGAATWVTAKVVKRAVRRGRPDATLTAARVLGRPQVGLGYPSGHAAVAASLAAVAAPALPTRQRRALWTVALLVGPARLYIGAHLPLDAVGGVGLGLAAGATVRSWPAQGRRGDRTRTSAGTGAVVDRR